MKFPTEWKKNMFQTTNQEIYEMMKPKIVDEIGWEWMIIDVFGECTQNIMNHGRLMAFNGGIRGICWDINGKTMEDLGDMNDS